MPSTADADIGLHRRRSARVSRNGGTQAEPDSGTSRESGERTTGLGLHPHGTDDSREPSVSVEGSEAGDRHTDAGEGEDEGEDDATTAPGKAGASASASAGGKIKSKGKTRRGIDLSAARKRVQEGLRSPLLGSMGGMKLAEFGEKFSEGVEGK
jgi:hypothetical protein